MRSQNTPAPDKKLTLLQTRLGQVRDLAASCRLCPRYCEVNRLKNELGVCNMEYGPVYSSANLHHGEEPPISGLRGSGTVFLTGCNLLCKFCQNYPISHLRNGNKVKPEKLAKLMIRLQDMGAHNINFVTPTHQAAAIFESLIYAYEIGLDLPIVYNCSGYDAMEMLELWDGIIDIYMPDAKYSSSSPARRISSAPDYLEHNRAALKEMYRQVGDLKFDEQDMAYRGLLIRHLVLPDDMSGTEDVLRFIAEEISRETYISLMSQYFPAYQVINDPLLNRPINQREYDRACELLEKYGLDNGWIQPFHGAQPRKI